MLEIIIWDENAIRIQEISNHMSQALKTLDMKAKVTLNSEPPLLSRMRLLDKTPVIEIENNFWECGKHPKTISVDKLIQLLKRYQ